MWIAWIDDNPQLNAIHFIPNAISDNCILYWAEIATRAKANVEWTLDCILRETNRLSVPVECGKRNLSGLTTKHEKGTQLVGHLWPK